MMMTSGRPFTRLILMVSLICGSTLIKCNRNSEEPHICQRTCEWPPEPKICAYKWKVEWFYAMGNICSIGCENSTQPNVENIACNQHPECIIIDGVPRPVTVVNRQLPGPSIQVCEGDIIAVDVFNDISETETEGTTIHWHGITQLNTPWMDGVNMVSQCPILYQQTFMYEFKASPAGTHWWHSHSGLQRADGMFGSLVVRQPIQTDPNGDLYDYDLPEHVVIVNDWYQQTAFRKKAEFFHNNGLLFPNTVLINGRGQRVDGDYNGYLDHEIFEVDKGQSYRFRVIGTGIGVCMMEVSVDRHILTVIALDGNSVKPYNVTSIVIDSAERYDFIIHADEEIGNYWFRNEGRGNCDGFTASGIVHYRGAPEDIPRSTRGALSIPDGLLNKCIGAHLTDNVPLMKLNAIGDFPTPKNVDAIHHISAHLVPAFDSNDVAPTFNRFYFRSPSSPLLYQWRDLNPERFCHVGNYTNCEETMCQCIHTIKVKYGEVVELVFLNEDNLTRCHPIHIHGHTFHVVAQRGLKDKITMDEFKDLDERGLIPRKLNNAPRKDSVHIPHYGYLIVRFVADNPGWWFLHCHTEWHVFLGMALVIQYEEDNKIPQPPPDFPRCGSWSPPHAPSTQVKEPAAHSRQQYAQFISDDKHVAESATSTESSSNVVLIVLLVIALSAVVVISLFIIRIKRNKKNSSDPEKRDLLQNEAKVDL